MEINNKSDTKIALFLRKNDTFALDRNMRTWERF